MPRVLLTDEQRRENQRINQQKQYAKNREKRLITQKEYREEHKEEIQEYRDTHREKSREYNKKHRQKPENLKIKTLSNWKRYGITFGEMTDSFFYDNIYLPMMNCQSCNKIFNETNKNDKKQADHKHEPLNPCNIRGVICWQCNIRDRWKIRLTEDSIYQQYL